MIAVLAALSVAVLHVKPQIADLQGGPKPQAGNAQAVGLYGHLPLIFEVNQGQSDAAVKFLARGAGYGLFLTKNEAVLVLQRSSSSQAPVVRMKLANADPNAGLVGTDELPGKSSYFIGNDPKKWYREIPQFARVRYRGVYPGVDLDYYGRQGRLEYDFEVAPGSDPQQVRLRFEGAKGLKLAGNGNLEVGLDGAELRLLVPRAYQKYGSEERTVAARFQVLGEKEVGFALGNFDRSRELVIDPVLTYSTYLGGSGIESCSTITGLPQTPGCPAIAVDSAGSVYVAGSTTSTNFPVTSGAYQGAPAAGFKANAFIAKFNTTGSALVYSTYLGGNGTDYTGGIAVDSAGNAYVAGTTTSSNFPTNGLNAPFQNAPLSTGKHVFVSVLGNTGSSLLYSTYLSGHGTDIASGLALDPSANIYVTGTTTSTESETGFPSTVGAFQVASNDVSSNQVYLTKLDAATPGTGSVVYSTYFGGSSPSNGNMVGGGVAVDTNSNAYITGATNFTNLPVLNAFQGTLAGGYDVFAARFNPTAVPGSQLVYSTYLGGAGDDFGYGIAVDSSFYAYVTGATNSTDDFGSTQSSGTALQGTYGGGSSDAFVAKLGVPCTGTSCTTTTVPLTYFTYLGGNGTDVGTAIAVDTIGGARITGWTNSPNFPVLNNRLAQTNYGGGNSDAFIARVDTTATTPTAPGHNSAYFGGNGADIGTSIATDNQGANYLAGETSSTSGFPLLNAFQPALDGPSDAFVSKLGPYVNVTVNETATPSPVGVGNQVSFTYTITNGINTNGVITNPGDYVSGITFTDTLPLTGVATFTSATGPGGNSCPAQPTNGTIVCNVGALNAGATATVTVVLTPVAPAVPNTGAVVLGNTGTVGIYGTNYSASPNPSASVYVNDFALSISPASVTVPAGVPASYTVVLTPTGSIPDAVTLTCAAGLPSGAKCTLTTNPIPNLSTGPASTTLVINTTARVTTTTRLWQRGPLYAAWLPIAGLALLGLGIGRKRSWRSRVLIIPLLAALFSLVGFQLACGSKKSTTTTTGTPAGTYVVTVSATSGSAVRNQTVTLVVQ